MSNPIERRLAYEDDRRHRRVIGQEDVAAIVEPVVILGDPGLGKSFLAQSLGVQPSMKYCRAGTFDRADRPETLIAQGERIIVDGLDEIASSTPGGAVDSVLRQLSRMGSPPFILTCRAADWNAAADRIQIEDDYGSAPVLLHLQPFRVTMPACSYRTNFRQSMLPASWITSRVAASMASTRILSPCACSARLLTRPAHSLKAA